MKNERYNDNDNKILYFYFFVYEKGYIMLENSLGKCSLYYYISSKVLFSVAGYLKRINETPTPI